MPRKTETEPEEIEVEAEVIEDSMEITISPDCKPGVINCDFTGARQKLEALIAPLQGMTVEDADNFELKDAKEVRANLNKIMKNLNSKRLEIEREFMAPFTPFKENVDELIAMAKTPHAVFDKSIKAREEKTKQLVYDNLKKSYEGFTQLLADVIPFDRFITQNPKWVTPSYGEKKAEKEILERAASLNRDWNELKRTPLHFPQETERMFFNSMSITDALEHDRIQWEQQQKIDAMKAEVQEQPEVPPITYVDNPAPVPQNGEVEYLFTVQVTATVTQATELKNHLQNLGLKFKMSRSREAVNG